MPFTPKTWLDRPSALAPQAGETLAQWETRVAAYAAANPGALTPVDAAALADAETRLAAYTDSVVSLKQDAATAATDAELALKQSLSEKGQANGYAPLNGSSRVPIANLASGTPDGTKFINDAGVLAVPPGGGSGVPRRIVGAMATNLGATLGVTFSGVEDVWVEGTLNSALVITLNAPRVAGASVFGQVLLDTVPRTITISDGAGGTTVMSFPASTVQAPVGLFRVYCPNTTDIDIEQVGAGGFANPMTAAGDLILGGTAGAAGRLGIGANATVLTSNGTTASWGTPDVTQAELDAVAATKADKTVTINDQTGTSYTPVLGDAGKLIRVSNAGTHTLTVPTNASVAFPVGTVINVARVGAGAVNVAAAGGVTINSPGGVLGLRVQYSQATLIKTLTDTWLLGGDIA